MSLTWGLLTPAAFSDSSKRTEGLRDWGKKLWCSMELPVGLGSFICFFFLYAYINSRCISGFS